MSADEDADLRELVAHTLESNGVLGKIKAELRAKVFMVLEAHDRNETNQLPVVNENLRNFMNTKEGRIATGLVREFMEFFDLEFSLAVFDPETNFGDRYQGRECLSDELGVINSSKPVLASLLENSSHGMPKLDLGSLNEDKLKKGRVSPESSPRSVSSGSRNNSPRVSRIPQRVKDMKRAEQSDTKYPKDLSPEKSPRADDSKLSFKGNVDLNDLSLNGDDNDILAEFTQPRHDPTKENVDNETNKDHLLGLKDLGLSSPSTVLKDLAEIDRRIDELGFGLPTEDKSPSAGDNYNDSYGEDFHTSTHSNDDNSSIQEELDGDPLSIDSYISEGSKADDLMTSDCTVSHMDFKDLDYGEEVENF